MNAIISKDKEFKDLIHVIREQQVMLDSDLAQLYGTEVKNLNRQVKRNVEKFPEDFMFQLNELETIKLSRCQNVTSIQTEGVKGGRSYNPYVFTKMKLLQNKVFSLFVNSFCHIITSTFEKAVNFFVNSLIRKYILSIFFYLMAPFAVTTSTTTIFLFVISHNVVSNECRNDNQNTTYNNR